MPASLSAMQLGCTTEGITHWSSAVKAGGQGSCVSTALGSSGHYRNARHYAVVPSAACPPLLQEPKGDLHQSQDMSQKASLSLLLERIVSPDSLQLRSWSTSLPTVDPWRCKAIQSTGCPGQACRFRAYFAASAFLRLTGVLRVQVSSHRHHHGATAPRHSCDSGAGDDTL